MFEHVFKIGDDSQIVCPNSELKAIYIYDFFAQKKKSVLVVTNTLYEANKIYYKLENYTSKILFFPMDDFLTSEALAISPELKVTRLETLNKLLNEDNFIVVTNMMGYLRYLPSKKIYTEKIITLKPGMVIDLKKLTLDLYELGYEQETVVTKTGEMAIRGYIIDIFPIDSKNPVRLELWGDEIETIKAFDVNTQLTLNSSEELVLKPITEFLCEVDSKKQRDLPKYLEVTNILGYLNNPATCFINYDDVKVAFESLKEEMFEYSLNNNLPADTKYMFNLNDINPHSSIFINDFDLSQNLASTLNISAKELEYYKISISDLKKEFANFLKSGKTVILALSNKGVQNKIYEALAEKTYLLTTEKEIYPNKVNIIVKKIESGFVYQDLVVFSEKELLNQKEETKKYKTNFTVGTKIRDINKLEVGDYVVHYKYGIGRYQGLKTLKKGSFTKEYLMLEYAGDDKLYIPVEKIDTIKKYGNGDTASPKLNRLNSGEWQKVKNRALKRVEDIAAELLELYAIREATPGFAYAKDDANQLEFEREFPYVETPDQLKVIKEIKHDMERSVPMDRLLCGDVGFGKTEVAFRAMFKAVLSHKQVAFLCPTTILSQQHFDNAKERFKDFPVSIALLNRFVTPAKVNKTLEELKNGQIDIIIGTHRLLSTDVIYKDLGLLVIDEEQRFGVKHKEKIKNFKHNIDVLTLSATPIPRTLQMSLAGMRNLSLIETPPTNRYPIQTYVLEENMQIIKDAIYKELSRGGQVYILSNRVEGIEEKVKLFSQAIKDVHFGYAHGQMNKKELEDIMNDFINKKYDVLICTTIIEIGIDIPSVNTIIILDADRFGLAQLYQIRGRVGRSNKIAYCYLMYSKQKILSEVATKRLKVIKEFTELGSGFAIAMRDLSIRGAGDILGSEQAGFVDAIGIEYFLEMLNNEIARLKGENVQELDKENDQPLLDVTTAIADDIVADEDLKIEIHKKINTIDSYEKLLEVKAEIKDRFGFVDDNLDVYMYEEWFEKLASSLNIKNVTQTKNSIIIGLPKELYPLIDGKKLFLEVNKLGNMFRFSERDGVLLITLDIVQLPKHFIYYLIDLLKVIKDCYKG